VQPGRVDFDRPAPAPVLARPASRASCAALLAAIAAIGGLGSCATRGAPHEALTRVWRDYSELPDQRALAIAGELERRERWVAGASGGHASLRDAEEAALRECARRRQERRMQDACRLYAVGDEVVWPGPVGSAPTPRSERAPDAQGEADSGSGR